MYAIGEKIVYGTNGVFEIIDVREEKVFGEAQEYYVLKRVSTQGDSLVYVPCENERLVAQMRYPLSADEAERLLSDIRSVEPAQWCRDSRRRSENYRALIESADARKTISVIKSVLINAAARKTEGKKGYISDENTLRRAEAVLCSELSVALGISEPEASERVLAACGEII